MSRFESNSRKPLWVMSWFESILETIVSHELSQNQNFETELNRIERNESYPCLLLTPSFDARLERKKAVLEDVKTMIKQCQTCAEIKPKFSNVVNTLIKAARHFERLSVDFKGPLPSKPDGNRYLLTVVDEFSRFVFAFPTKDTSSESAIQCLCSHFSTHGMPEYVCSDWGSAFTSGMYRQFMTERGIAISYSSAYNPRGNGQVERYNGVL